MDIIGFVFCVLSVFAFAVVIGFAITWLVGFVKKSKSTSSVGKMGTIISGSIALAFLLIGVGLIGIYDYQHSKKEQEFIAVSEKFQKEYDATIFSLNEKNKLVNEEWSYYITDDDENDYELPPGIDDITSEFSESEMDKHFDKMENDISQLKKYDTGDLKLNYHYYRKALNKLDKYRDITYHPSAKDYLDYADKSVTYEMSVEKYSSKIKKFNNE